MAKVRSCLLSLTIQIDGAGWLRAKVAEGPGSRIYFLMSLRTFANKKLLFINLVVSEWVVHTGSGWVRGDRSS